MSGPSTRHVVMRRIEIVRDRGVCFAGPRPAHGLCGGWVFAVLTRLFGQGLFGQGFVVGDRTPLAPLIRGEFLKTARAQGQHLQSPPDKGGWRVTPTQAQGRSGARLCPTPYTAADIPYRRENRSKSLIHKSSGGDIRRMSQVLVPSDPSHHEAASGQLHPG